MVVVYRDFTRENGLVVVFFLCLDNSSNRHAPRIADDTDTMRPWGTNGLERRPTTFEAGEGIQPRSRAARARRRNNVGWTQWMDEG